eukprot:TCONS_00029612-protein
MSDILNEILEGQRRLKSVITNRSCKDPLNLLKPYKIPKKNNTEASSTSQDKRKHSRSSQPPPISSRGQVEKNLAKLRRLQKKEERQIKKLMKRVKKRQRKIADCHRRIANINDPKKHSREIL